MATVTAAVEAAVEMDEETEDDGMGRMPLLSYLAGCVTVCLPCRMRRIYTAQLLRNAYPLVAVVSGAGGDLFVTMRTRVWRDYAQTLSVRGIPLPTVTSRRGLPYVLGQFSGRPGVFIGAFFASGIVVLSTLFCWRVDVVCLDNAQAVRAEDHVDTEAVRGQLADMGIGAGTFLPSLDVRSAEKKFLVQSDTVSWIAINRRGNVLSAEVRSAHAVSKENSAVLTEDGDGVLAGTNLIADTDGRILSWEVGDGHVLVSHEQMVTRGTLLATGFYESKDGDVIYSRAKGKVFAETVRTLCAEIPLNVAENVYTGGESKRYTLSFFGVELPTVTVPAGLFAPSNVTFLEIFQNWRKKSGLSDVKYDTIIDEHPLTLKDGTRLPLTLKTEVRLYKTEAVRTLTKEEATALAEQSLAEQLSGMTDAVVLSAETNTVWEEDRLIVTRDVYCIDNIAVQVPYYVKNEEP